MAAYVLTKEFTKLGLTRLHEASDVDDSGPGGRALGLLMEEAVAKYNSEGTPRRPRRPTFLGPRLYQLVGAYVLSPAFTPAEAMRRFRLSRAFLSELAADLAVLELPPVRSTSTEAHHRLCELREAVLAQMRFTESQPVVPPADRIVAPWAVCLPSEETEERSDETFEKIEDEPGLVVDD